MARKLKTAVIGFGRIAQGYAGDPLMAKYMPYSTHAQVLAKHPAFEWCAVVDPDSQSRVAAANKWGVATTADSIDSLSNADEIEVAILATPANKRLEFLDKLPNLKAVIAEKPLGVSLLDAEKFIAECRRRNILLQVNLLRRADKFTRQLAAGELSKLVGRVQAASGFYGNGLLNNGTHMVDLVRMLLGEVKQTQALGEKGFVEGPIEGDQNPAFALLMDNGLNVVMQPVRFSSYRENGIDIWGESGRLTYFHGGLTLAHYGVDCNRALQGENEIVHDRPMVLLSTLGESLYEMYTNLAEALNNGQALFSPSLSALKTQAVIDAIMESSRLGGQIVQPRETVKA